MDLVTVYMLLCYPTF